MSIYRRPKLFDLGGKRSPPAPGKVPARAAGSGDWSKVRKASPAEHLLPSTRTWMERLPPEVFPAALAAQFPRIANLIATAWSDRDGCILLFQGLLTDKRGGERRGFPAAVERDLENLRDYWYNGSRIGPEPGSSEPL
jgi:hypothetical protein